ncbi:T9SS type A sorting domain-containing protein [Psychroflexus sp. ALD_RP9]|uniref:T9SS type A sorting domain-containing protein n=1 Tax=Psychroflexus sp. ALD_RP9 TaxID=2777186 RepID=UPI001A903725|nr:T9SS type A sorting domain-containing protein [Psychroflexus sp. ALD_RP9]QSS96184.1 T9SS type A sorting domain-containing protein [Psychroflexus sp. ALD_RP9]
MKKITFIVFALMASFSFAQGLEDFTNSNATSGYADDSFVGNNGITWTYVASRDGNGDANSSGINLPALMLRRVSDNSKITSSTISGGIGDFSMKLYKGFTGGGDRQVEVFINGISVGTSQPFDDFTEQTFSVSDINVGGDIIIEIVNITPKQVIIDDISWTAFAGAPTPTLSVVDAEPSGSTTTVAPSELDQIELEFNVANFTVGTDGYISWEISNVTDGVTHQAGDLLDLNNQPIQITPFEGGKQYVLTAVLKDNNDVELTNPEANYTLTANAIGYVEVADLAALRNGATDGTFYKVTGEVVLTYQQSFRGQKYVQDASAGILIDDDPGAITSTYNVEDGITGLSGTLNSFNGMLQFNPDTDPGAATSTGNTVNPQILTISEFNTNFENYEGELVAFENITFTTADGVITFDNGDAYPIEDAGQNSTLVEALFNLAYTGDIVPTNTVNVAGLAGEENNGEYRIYPRDNDIDVTLSNTSFTNSDVVLYPNPVKGNLVNISISNANTFTVEVYNVLGKQVLKQTANNSAQLNTASLKSGVYLVKVTEGNQSLTKKLVVQ